MDKFVFEITEEEMNKIISSIVSAPSGGYTSVEKNKAIYTAAFKRFGNLLTEKMLSVLLNIDNANAKAAEASQDAGRAGGVAAEAKYIAESAEGIASLAHCHAVDAETTAQSAKSLAENSNTVAKETKDMFWSISDKVDDLESYKITESQAREIAQEEIAKFDFIKIVAELPEEGLPNRFYLVPKTESGTNDLFDSWLWVNDAWEYEGSKTAEIDSNLYVKFTDVITTQKMARVTEPGLVRLSNLNYGIGIRKVDGIDGVLSVMPASDWSINNGRKESAPVFMSQFDKTLKYSLTDGTAPALTDEEQTNACDWLGAVKKQTADRLSVYAVDKNGNAVLIGTSQNAANNGMIPLYSSAGKLNVGLPQNGNQAANKYYVDGLPDYLTMDDDDRAMWLSMLGATKLYKQTISITPSGTWENYDRLIVISSKKEAITDQYELVAEIMNHSGYIAYDDGTAYHKIVSVFDGFECVVCDLSDNGFTLKSLDLSTILGFEWSSDIVSVEEI
jgi:hypothetical protein